MKAIPVQPLCLTCHGAKDQMSPFILEQLGTEYPHDRATGLQSQDKSAARSQ